MNRKQASAGIGVGLAACLFLAGFGTTGAASAERISIELNRLEDIDGNCRLTFVLTNALAVPVDTLKIETVLFDPEGRVDRFLLLKARPLPAGKTRVQQFDVDGAACGSIGRVLLNDVDECTGGDLAAPQCLALIATVSRTNVPFVTTLSGGSDQASDG